MKHFTLPRFWQHYQKLPRDIQSWPIRTTSAQISSRVYDITGGVTRTHRRRPTRIQFRSRKLTTSGSTPFSATYIERDAKTASLAGRWWQVSLIWVLARTQTATNAEI